jgi:hypothetical protein
VRQFSQNGKVDSIEKLKARILWLTQCDTIGKLKIENITPISSVAGATDPLILLLAKIANLLSSDTYNLLNTITVKFFFKKKFKFFYTRICFKIIIQVIFKPVKLTGSRHDNFHTV